MLKDLGLSGLRVQGLVKVKEGAASDLKAIANKNLPTKTPTTPTNNTDASSSSYY